MLKGLFRRDQERRAALAAAVVVPEPARCVECGICSFNCPLGIDVRSRARRGVPISESYCLSCGECVARCPRGTLRMEQASLFAPPARGGAE